MKRGLDDGKGFLRENKARGRIAQASGARKHAPADYHPKRTTGHVKRAKRAKSRGDPAFRLSRIRFSTVRYDGETPTGNCA